MDGMASIVEVAPSAPEEEVLQQAVTTLRSGGVIGFPTDTLYGIGCAMGAAEGIERIQRMRGFDGAKRPLTFILPDMGELPRYTQVSETTYRILTRIFPGPYCAELQANGNVPSPFVQADKRTIGVRIPDSALCEKLAWSLGRPILSATAKSRDGQVLTSAAEIEREYGADIDLILDGGELGGPPSTVVSLVDDWITVLREGRGPSNRLIG
jgi:tRNA threonylcarbamoyl adenosine modification protein (Sua5/YciO/YrdC/YwlC family)